MLSRRLLAATGGLGSFIGGLGMAEYVLVAYSTTESVNHNTATDMTFDTAVHDPDGYWSAGDPTKLTIPAGKGGVFIVQAGTFVGGTAVPTQDCIIYIQKNDTEGVIGSVRSYPQTGANGNPIGYIATNPVTVALTEGQYVKFIVYIDNPAGAITFGNSLGSPTWIALTRLSS
jgi:hypothetical protein